MIDRETLLDALSDSAMERLRDGEEVEILVEKREPNPLIEDDRPRSMNTITLTLQTKGVIDDSSLAEKFPEVVGLDE